MGSHRPPSRVWNSGLRGGVGPDDEDDGPVWTPSPTSRNYLLSVRPEIRSTFCSIIAQLTEETQPLFETTLKSRAVSADCDARFTCIVTGYPEPEVTWYKDDEELDRYCGLPKYEISQQGNRHTLQLYKCQEEDAAIYQASARNAKGIVSCSGVLEVGTMTEYKIHQRWFAKLKRKAEAKMREIEQSRKYGKDMVSEADMVRKLSPDRFQRKRRLSGAREKGPLASYKDFEVGALEPELEGETNEPSWTPAIGLANNFTGGEVTANGDATLESGEESGDGLLSYICETVELISQRPPTKESVAKKKKKEERPRHKGMRTSEQKSEGARTSENHIPTTAESDSSWTRGHTEVENTPLTQRENSLKTTKLGRADRTLESTSPVAHEARGSSKIGVKTGKGPRTPTPESNVYFSLKDLYLENTQSIDTEERLQTPSGNSQSGILLGALPGRETEEKLPPGQSVPPSAQQLPRVFNRKRFAPPKPKCDPNNDSQPCASVATHSGILGPSPQQGAQASGISPEPAATVPTPPARRKHKTRESPAQKLIAHRTPYEAPETQVARAPATSANSSSAAECLSHNVEGEQGSGEPMDVETQEEEKMKRDGRTPMDVSAQMESAWKDVRTQEDSRTRVDLRTQADVNRQVVGRTNMNSTQRDGRTQVVAVTRPERESSHNPQSIAFGFQIPEAPQRPGHFKRLPVESSHPSQVRSEEMQFPALGNTQESLPAPIGPEVGGRPVDREESRGLGQLGPTEVDKVAQQPQEELLLPTEEPINTDHEASMEGSDPVVKATLGLASDSHPTSPLSPMAPSTPRRKAACLPTNNQGGQVQRGPTKVALMPCPEAAQVLGCSEPEPEPPCEALPRVGPPSQGHRAEIEAARSRGNALGAHGESEAEIPGAGLSATSPVGSDSGLIDSLKNYLLLLLKLSSADTELRETEARGRPEGQQPPAGGPGPPDTLAPTVEIAGLSPRTSRKILERVENNHLIQSAQSLQLSPCTSRRLTGLIDQEVQLGHKALAAGKPLGRYPSSLTVPTIVVGEETYVQGPEKNNKGASEEIGAGPKESRMGESLWGSSGDQGSLRMGEPLGESKREEPFRDAELPGATPEELALGARRKRFLPKAKVGGEGEAPAPEDRESPTVSPRGSRKSLAPGSPLIPPKERHSPTQSRKMLEVPRPDEDSTDLGSGPKDSGPDVELAPEDGKQDETAKPRRIKDLFKAPQVIRKIRVEQFPDASGSLKLWCQFFNILSDSVLTWTKDQLPVAEVERSAGDEGPAALAIVQASPRDCGVYQCTIQNEHGTDSTNFCLSPEVLSGFVSREEVEVGEEIEMTPMVFAKGLADSGCWGDKLFGRLVTGELRGSGRGRGLRKASQAKVIYGLEPIFESGRTCVIKVPNLLVFGSSSENALLGRNYDVTIQGCKIQNMSREYCKIFAAEARAVPGFGEVPEIIPLYLIYRPANSIPYATLEEYLGRPLEPYCARDWESGGTQVAPVTSEAAQKCRTFQHWLYQWTNGSFLVTDLAGVDWKMTDVQIATKLRGYQGLKESCFPGLLEQFAVSHQCNTHCEMLGLKSLKSLETLYPVAKAKGSKSPSSGRKAPSSTQLSPQLQKKGHLSPQGSRKSTSSLKAVPRSPETADTQLNNQPAAQERGSKAQGM